MKLSDEQDKKLDKLICNICNLLPCDNNIAICNFHKGRKKRIIDIFPEPKPEKELDEGKIASIVGKIALEYAHTNRTPVSTIAEAIATSKDIYK